MSCLDSDRKMDLLTIPRHWKNVVVTIVKPTKGIIRLIVRNPFSASPRR